MSTIRAIAPDRFYRVCVFLIGCLSMGVLGAVCDGSSNPFLFYAVDMEADGPLGATPLSVDDTSLLAEIDTAGDVDYFSFSAKEGHIYEIRTESYGRIAMALFQTDDSNRLASQDYPSSCQARIRWRAEEDSDLFVAVSLEDPLATGRYQIALQELYDDVGDDFSHATAIEVDATAFSAEMQYPNDNDVFVFQVVAGTSYRVSIGGESGIWLELSDGVNSITPSWSEDSLFNDQAEWVSLYSGNCYIRCSSYGNQEYTIQVESFTDDYASLPEDAPLIEVDSNGRTVTGQIDFQTDVDYFRFFIQAGDFLTVSAQYDQYLQLYLFADDGQTVLTSGYYGQLSWKAEISSDYYLAVAGDIDEVYTLELTAQPDDFGDDPGHASTIEVNASPVLGTISSYEDMDCFVFTAEQGRTYVIQTAGPTDTALGVATYDQEFLDVDYDSGEGYNAYLEWLAPDSGDYYIFVASDYYGLGRYELSITSTLP